MMIIREDKKQFEFNFWYEFIFTYNKWEIIFVIEKESLREKILLLEDDIADIYQNKEIWIRSMNCIHNILTPICDKYLKRLNERENNLDKNLVEKLRSCLFTCKILLNTIIDKMSSRIK